MVSKILLAVASVASVANGLEATPLRIGTRGSPLALAQVRFVSFVVVAVGGVFLPGVVLRSGVDVCRW